MQVKYFHIKSLYRCSHVFLRIDRVKKPLELPYDGPFLVLQRSPIYFKLLIKFKQINISIDRLKPAYMLKSADDEILPSTSKTDPTSIVGTHTQPDTLANGNAAHCAK